MSPHRNLKSSRWIFTTGLLLTLILTLIRPGSAAQAASYVVSLKEESLRLAIIAANANAGADTITFSASGTILLTKVLPGITDPAGLTIDGAGQNIILSGNHALRVLEVILGGALTVRNLTIADGYIDIGGGGIFNNGTLTVAHTTFSGNQVGAPRIGAHGGGIYNSATATVTDSIFSENSATHYGGGIFNNGTMSVTNSTFTDNDAAYGGGGLGSGGTLTVIHSTFSGNAASGAGGGGGITSEFGQVTVTDSTFVGNTTTTQGGGIAISAGAVTVTSSTVAGNSAPDGGGIFNRAGTVTVTGSTFAGNSALSTGGGITNGSYGTVEVTNSTFSGNSAPDGSGVFNDGSSISGWFGNATVTNSTFSGNAGGGSGIVNHGNFTLQNTITANSNAVNCSNDSSLSDGGGNLSWPDTSCPGMNTDPLLGPLQDNDGLTQTYALLAGSPALDAAVLANCPTTDQRGVSRPQGAGCDIGAYERGVEVSPPSIILNSPADGAVYNLGQAVPADYGCQDESGGSGLASCIGTVSNGSLIDTGSVGAKTFTVNAADNAGNLASLTHHYSVVYTFSGFFQPVDDLPTFNTIKAGVGIPVRFNLGGNQGLDIFAAGYPATPKTTCTGGTPEDAIEETVIASSSNLSYDTATDTYTYTWKTNSTWAGSCRQLNLRLKDGSEHKANFKFVR